MFEERGLLHHPFFLRGFTSENQHNLAVPAPSSEKENPFQFPSASEFNLEEEDLFTTPELMTPILEESVMNFDPLFASILSAEENFVSSIPDIAPVNNDPLFSEDFYECKEEVTAKPAIEDSLCEESELKLPLELESEVKNINPEMDLKHSVESEKLPLPDIRQILSSEYVEILEGAMQKSTSSGCLTSVEWVNGDHSPKFLDFGKFNLGAALELRRAHSEGDIQTLDGDKTSCMLPQFEPLTIEGREQKLLRYRNKKAKRNYSRKIKYACRKALADSQPRVRGRFARTEEALVSNVMN